MRQIGSLASQTDAERFTAFLVTAGVAAHAEEDGDGWAIWVRDENQLDTAREALSDYRSDPDAEQYQGVEKRAEELLHGQQQRREQARKNVIQMRGRWKGGASSRHRPLVITIIALSIGVFLATDRGRNRPGIVMRTLLFRDPIHQLDQTIADRLVDIRQGQIWRFITPAFIHFGAMHLAFNMIMFYQLGSLVEDRRGTWRMGLLVLSTAAVSTAVQCLVPREWGGGTMAGGMSGVLYGVFGYMWMKSRYQPELGIHISPSTVTILLGWMLFCMSGLMERFGVYVANWAHGAGFLAGVAIGCFPILFRASRRW